MKPSTEVLMVSRMQQRRRNFSPMLKHSTLLIINGGGVWLLEVKLKFLLCHIRLKHANYMDQSSAPTCISFSANRTAIQAFMRWRLRIFFFVAQCISKSSLLWWECLSRHCTAPLPIQSNLSLLDPFALITSTESQLNQIESKLSGISLNLLADDVKTRRKQKIWNVRVEQICKSIAAIKYHLWSHIKNAT